MEQVIGKIKNSYGDKEGARSYDMAVGCVIAKVVLFNYCFLISLLFFIRLFKYLMCCMVCMMANQFAIRKRRKPKYKLTPISIFRTGSC